VALITGGGTGIGRATAEKLAGQGYHVVILGRREQPLRETSEAIGASSSWYPLDVSQRDQVAATMTLVVERWGQVDVLVNAAGFATGVRAGMPLDEAANNWDETIAANLTGAFLMSIAVAPYLTRPGGRIISISSIAAYTGGQRGGSIDYAAAKAGLIGMTHGLARDLSKEGITANVVVPASSPRRNSRDTGPTSASRASSPKRPWAARATPRISRRRWPTWPRQRRRSSLARCCMSTAAGASAVEMSATRIEATLLSAGRPRAL
jgi:3-oxoacyl-[acyl-carrier protein] reductase